MSLVIHLRTEYFDTVCGTDGKIFTVGKEIFSSLNDGQRCRRCSRSKLGKQLIAQVENTGERVELLPAPGCEGERS